MGNSSLGNLVQQYGSLEAAREAIFAQEEAWRCEQLRAIAAAGGGGEAGGVPGVRKPGGVPAEPEPPLGGEGDSSSLEEKEVTVPSVETLPFPCPSCPSSPSSNSISTSSPSPFFEHVYPALQAVGCGSWYCNCGCAKRKGILLRKDLGQCLKGCSELKMITFTVDRELFPEGPGQALRYVCKRRIISKVLESLRRDHPHAVHSEEWFAVLEFHKDGWPHWHVLIHAGFVPIKAIQMAWDKFRPRWAGPLKTDRKGNTRAGLGYCDIEGRTFGGEHAANYVTKYLTKTPRHGVPAWVLDCPHRIRRYSTSKYFWPRGDVEPRVRKKPLKKLAFKTVRERLAGCGKEAKINIVRESFFEPDEPGQPVRRVKKVQYLGRPRMSFAEGREAIGDRCRGGTERMIYVDPEDLISLIPMPEPMVWRLRELKLDPARVPRAIDSVDSAGIIPVS